MFGVGRWMLDVFELIHGRPRDSSTPARLRLSRRGFVAGGIDASLGGARTARAGAAQPAARIPGRRCVATRVDPRALRKISNLRRRAVDQGARQTGQSPVACRTGPVAWPR